MKNLAQRLHTKILSSLQARSAYWAWRSRRRFIALRLDTLGLAHAPTVRTYTHPDELEVLFQLASECPAKGNIVEFGSYLGASTCYLAAGSFPQETRVFCIDTWQNETMPDGLSDTFAEFQRHTAGVASRITVVRKKTAEVQPSDLPAQVDLAFIDADHSYEATKADTALLTPLLTPEGILAFHDTNSFEGVSRVLAELLATGKWCIAGHRQHLTWLRRATWRNGSSAPVPATT